MSLFSKPTKLKFKLMPSTPLQEEKRSYLDSLSDRELVFPEEQVADLTANEKKIQSQLPSYLNNTQSDYEAGRSYLNDVLSGSYDPRTSDYYQGLRQEQASLKADSQNNVRRQAQKAGMARSTPSQSIQADVGRQYDTQTLKELGALYENERSRMGAAATGLQTLGSQYTSNLGNAQNIAAVERQNQQAKLSAVFNAAVQTMLAPYQYNAQIASALLNEQRYASYQTGGGMTDLGFITSAAAGMFGSYAAGGGFNSIGQVPTTGAAGGGASASIADKAKVGSWWMES